MATKKPVMQGGGPNYLGKQKMVTAPKKWKSSPTHPEAHLAYITDAEQDLLIKKDLYGSLKGKPNRGPSGIVSLQGDLGGYDASPGGADSPGGGGGDNEAQNIAAQNAARTKAVLTGKIQRDPISGNWEAGRNLGRRDSLAGIGLGQGNIGIGRSIRGDLGGRRSRLSGILGALGRGALGFLGGIPGKVMSGIMTASDWAKRKGTGAWEGLQEFGEHDNLMSYLNRNKVQALDPVETIDIREKFDRTGNVLPSNLTPNMGANNQMVDPNFLALGAADGGRIGYRDGLFVDENIEGPGYDFNEGMEIASAPDPMDALNDFSLEIFNKPYDQLNDEERGILHDLANEQVMGEQDQGIASLV